VVIVGGGNFAGQAAVFLARHAARVALVVREQDLGEYMSRYLIDQVLRIPNVRIGVGGRCQAVEDFPRSYREAELAMGIQKASGGPEQITLYDDLGVSKVLASANDTSSMERFVDEWLAPLIDHDSARAQNWS
jgi:sugar diacid utilization regulator